MRRALVGKVAPSLRGWGVHAQLSLALVALKLPLESSNKGTQSRLQGELAWEPSASPLDRAGFLNCFLQVEWELSEVSLPQDPLCCSSCQRAL